MEKHVIILNGASSSGKTTLSRVLQDLIMKKRSELYKTVSIDEYLKMSVNDAIYEDDVYDISPVLTEAARQALSVCGGVIIDHVITSKRIFDQLAGAFKECDIKLIHVTCPRKILVMREKARGNRSPGSAEASDAYLFPKDGYDLTVDTHAMSAAECAERIFQCVFCSR